MWVSMSEMKLWSLIVLSNHSAFHRWSTQWVTVLLLSDKLMSYCAAGTNGHFNLRRRAFALGQVSAEWSRFPGSKAQHARDSVAPLWQKSVGWMPMRMGRLSAGVGCKYPVTICKAFLMAESEHWHSTRQQCSIPLLNGPGLRWLFATWFYEVMLDNR